MADIMYDVYKLEYAYNSRDRRHDLGIVPAGSFMPQTLTGDPPIRFARLSTIQASCRQSAWAQFVQQFPEYLHRVNPMNAERYSWCVDVVRGRSWII